MKKEMKNNEVKLSKKEITGSRNANKSKHDSEGRESLFVNYFDLLTGKLPSNINTDDKFFNRKAKLDWKVVLAWDDLIQLSNKGSVNRSSDSQNFSTPYIQAFSKTADKNSHTNESKINRK